MCWKISCFQGFCRSSANAQATENGVRIDAASKMGAIQSAGECAIAVQNGNLTETTNQSIEMGSNLRAHREGAFSVGRDGAAIEYEKNVEAGCLSLSIGERLACCTDQGCCFYSISCGGSDCSISSAGCIDAVKGVAGSFFSCIGSLFSAAVEMVAGVSDSE